MASEFVPSVCPHDCPSTCAIEVERLDARTIGRVRGAAEHAYTDGCVCAKVGRYAERTHHPDRLRHPLIRMGEGFERVSWDTALDAVAEAFMAAADRHGPEAVWPYQFAGTMGLVQRDGIERLRNVMGYSGQDKNICTMASKIGWKAGCGSVHGSDSREIVDSDVVVMWGANPVHTHIQLMNLAMTARKTRGARIVSVDPYRNRTAALADMHLALRPGTDGALACAVMHVLFKEGFADRDYMARLTDVPERLESHLESRTPAWASAITGLSEEEIVAFARLYGSTKRSFIRLGYGFTRTRNGAVNTHAVTCLPAVTGAWQVRGGGALAGNGDLYPIDKTLIEGLDARDSSVRVFDMSRIGPILCGDVGEGPPVTAMLIQNTNPVTVAPESAKVREGFLRDDLFVCVHEQFMTDTAALADVVLPATTFVEHDDIYIAGCHSFLLMGRQVIEPYAECRSNHEVNSAVAERLGAVHPGFAMTAWEVIDATLKTSGLPDAETLARERWHDCQLGFEDSHFLNGFATPDGRFRFSPDWAALGPYHEGLPDLPDHVAVIDAGDGEHPFRLVAAPARHFLNTSFTETPTSRKQEGRPTALIHPADCDAIRVAEGDVVRLGNRRGTVMVHAKPFDGLQRGVVVVESIWPNGDFMEGRGINTLISADPCLPAGGAVFHDTAVWLERAQ